MIAGECRVCGCTEEQACIFFDGRRLTDRDLEQLSQSDPLARELVRVGSTTCSWIEPDLCSAYAQGKPLRGAP